MNFKAYKRRKREEKMRRVVLRFYEWLGFIVFWSFVAWIVVKILIAGL